jgi:hypothetical protein
MENGDASRGRPTATPKSVFVLEPDLIFMETYRSATLFDVYRWVHLGKHSRVSDFVWIFPNVVLTNDPHPPSDLADLGVHVGRFAVIGTNVTILPGLSIGADSLVSASSLVTRDVPDGQLVRGVPAKIIGPASMVTLRDGTGRPAYPWRQHFHRGYPEEVVAEWMKPADGYPDV